MYKCKCGFKLSNNSWFIDEDVPVIENGKMGIPIVCKHCDTITNIEVEIKSVENTDEIYG